MIALIVLGLLGASFETRANFEAGWKWISPGMSRLERRRVAITNELAALDLSTSGHTANEIGYQHRRLNFQPLTNSWVQVDLTVRRTISTVVLVPALVDWQSQQQPAFAFPIRFRVDLSDDPEFKDFASIASFTDQDFPNPGIAPVIIDAGDRSARYIRLTVTKLAQVEQKYFFALSELMVISGNLNVAIGRPVSASGSVEMAPRWSVNNLVDGRTPLGPPINRELLKWDGLYAGPEDGVTKPWMQLDLGSAFPLEQIRLHPIHSRLGSDVPGFFFPKHLRIEASLTSDFNAKTVLFDSGDYSNPGDNPFTIWAEGCTARYIKITAVKCYRADEYRFGLSEVQVYSGGTNVALHCAITRTIDPPNKHWSWSWPMTVLTDGFTSYGRLLELPDWLNAWKLQRALRAELQNITLEQGVLMNQAQKRSLFFGVSFLTAITLTIIVLIVVARRRRDRALTELRISLARDLHDDIGSNLAGIAVISEVAGDTASASDTSREDWDEVNRIARETLGAMREVVWLVGGHRETSGLHLMTNLKQAAARMLAGKEIIWKSTIEQLPPELPWESRREIFLIFKEALSNIVRHANATRVELLIELSSERLLVSIGDNGRGFNTKQVREGLGLSSQQLRVRSISGSLKIESGPKFGTLIVLEVPLKKKRAFLPVKRLTIAH